MWGKICGRYRSKSLKTCSDFLVDVLPIDLMDSTCAIHWVLEMDNETSLYKINWLQRMSDERHLLSLSIVICFIFHLKVKRRITLNWLVNYSSFWTSLKQHRKGYMMISGVKANGRISSTAKAFFHKSITMLPIFAM